MTLGTSESFRATSPVHVSIDPSPSSPEWIAARVDRAVFELARSQRELPELRVRRCAQRSFRDTLRSFLDDVGELLVPGLALQEGETRRRRTRAPLGLEARCLRVVASLTELASVVFPASAGSNTGRVGTDIACDLLAALPQLRGCVWQDVQAVVQGDPAATGAHEVISVYPGIRALLIYRVAHCLCDRGLPMIPRALTEIGHELTGIDIHPAAQLGSGVSIDHGSGLVIGATTVVGDRVRLYHDVTLGARSIGARELADPRAKRHPTLEDDVTVYAGASVLGGDTVVGRGAVIGAGAVVLSSVPPYVRVGALERWSPRSHRASPPPKLGRAP